MQRLQRLQRWALSWPSLAGTAAGVPGCGLLASVTSGGARVGWIAGSLACAVAAGTTTWLRDRQAQQDRDEARERAEDSSALAKRLTSAFTGSGTLLVTSLGRLAAGKEAPDAALARLVECVLEVARNECGVDPAENRACLYLWDGADELTLNRHRGRNVPRNSFTRDDVPHGRSVLEFMEAAPPGVQRYSDLMSDKPPGFGDPRDRGYRTFVSAPVTLGDRPYGILTVDSPVAHSLTATDEGMVTLLAQLLAVGMTVAERERGRPPTDRGGDSW